MSADIAAWQINPEPARFEFGLLVLLARSLRGETTSAWLAASASKTQQAITELQ
ncbi:MAG: hypothetical protein HC895_09220 [Leptolyngbyaceae cyanobacterium SM1_3_5]|nr:hypothetical protein [Leptolyngbyaceae cyanobacterium SM1_3_5]